MPDLVEPLIPIANNIAMENMLRGFGLVAGINQRNREIQLEGQQMEQKERLAQEQFNLDRAQMEQNQKLSDAKMRIDQEKIDQDKPLIDAEAEAYKSLGTLRRTQSENFAKGIGTAAQRKAKDEENATSLAKDLVGIHDLIGTKAWQHQAPLFLSNYPQSDAVRKVYASNLSEHYKATTTNRMNQSFVINNFKRVMSPGLPPSAFQDPYRWADIPGSKGSMKYMLMDKTGSPIPPENAFFDNPEYIKKKYGDGVTAARMNVVDWKTGIESWKKIQEWQLKMTMAPGDEELPQMPLNTPVNSGPANTTYTRDPETGELIQVPQ